MYSTVAEIRARNKALGHHFFDKSTMHFFRSKVGNTVYGGRYFITSEQFSGSDYFAHPRAYTIRRANDDGSIDTIGDFNAYPSHNAARAAIREMFGV